MDRQKIIITKPTLVFGTILLLSFTVLCWIFSAITFAKILELDEDQTDNLIIFIVISGFSMAAFWYFVISKINRLLKIEEPSEISPQTQPINREKPNEPTRPI